MLDDARRWLRALLPALPPLLLLLSSSVPAASQTPPAPPVVEFKDSSVIAKGVTPGGRVAVFGVMRDVDEEEVATLRRRYGIQTDSDADGEVIFNFDVVAPVSAWVAVDLSSGAYSVAGPADSPLAEVPFRGAGLVTGIETSDHVQDDRTYVDSVLVRPGVSGEGWWLTVGDGALEDQDLTADAKVSVPIDQMQPLGIQVSAAPSHLIAKDLVFVFDPANLEVSVQQIQEVAP